ncbi:MAG: ABC transporter substrate-binding protein [Janthinobacterium lividum]
MTKPKVAIRAVILATLGPVLATFLTGCSPAQPSKTEHLIVQLPLYPQGSDGFLFLALKKKMFEKAGLDVEILDGRGSNYAIQLVTSNHADIGSATLTPVVFADQRGADAVVIAELWPNMGPAVIAAKGTGIASPSDLKGKRVALASAGPWPALLPSFLAKFGMTEKDLQLQYVDVNAIFSTYASKQVDAILTIDTGFSEAQPLRDSVMLRGDHYGVDLPGAGLFTTQSALSGPKRAAIARFMAVCLQALDDEYAGHQDEAVDAILSERPNTKLPRKKLREQVDMFEPAYRAFKIQGVPQGTMAPEKWARHIAYMKSIGMLKGDVDTSKLYTNSLLTTASK